MDAFRHVNDSIRQLAPEGPDTETLDFFCECRDIECNATVSLTLLEFDTRRAASPPVAIVAAHGDIQPSRARRVRAYIERRGLQVGDRNRLRGFRGLR
jgi:hypothetical protein